MHDSVTQCSYLLIMHYCLSWAYGLTGSAGRLSLGVSCGGAPIGGLMFHLELPNGIYALPQLPVDYHPPNEENQNLAFPLWFSRGRSPAHTALEERGIYYHVYLNYPGGFQE